METGVLRASLVRRRPQEGSVLVSKASIFPRSSLLGAGQLGFWEAGKGGWINWVKGYKRGQFTDNLGPRWTNPVTSGGSQVSGRGYKGELEGMQGEQEEQGGMRHIYMQRNMCARVIELLE
jgi:hypothetical protein